MTVRQIFYRLVSRGAIAKTEGEYKSTVVRLLAEARGRRERAARAKRMILDAQIRHHLSARGAARK